MVFPLTTEAIDVEAVVTSDCVASEPLESVAPVSVLVAYVHTSEAVSAPPPEILEIAASMLVASTFPIEPTVVMVLVATFQILAGSAVIDAPRDVEAVRICALVLAFTTAAMDEEAVPIVVLTDVVARLISTFVAREPDVRPAPVRVRVAEIQTSEASVPKDESVRTLEFQTFVGIVSASEVEAVLMVELTEVVTAPVCVLVLALTTAATEDEAV